MEIPHDQNEFAKVRHGVQHKLLLCRVERRAHHRDDGEGVGSFAKQKYDPFQFGGNESFSARAPYGPARSPREELLFDKRSSSPASDDDKLKNTRISILN
jgi:hypothetical protein